MSGYDASVSGATNPGQHQGSFRNPGPGEGWRLHAATRDSTTPRQKRPLVGVASVVPVSRAGTRENGINRRASPELVAAYCCRSSSFMGRLLTCSPSCDAVAHGSYCRDTCENDDGASRCCECPADGALHTTSSSRLMYRPTSSTKRPSASASRHASADWIASLPRLATRRVIDSVERCAESSFLRMERRSRHPPALMGDRPPRLSSAAQTVALQHCFIAGDRLAADHQS